MNKERYQQNRARVCEIYRVDPQKCSCHHIVERSDAKDRRSSLYQYDVDQLSNLYPFETDLGHGTSSEHIRTHQLIDKRETKVIYKKKRKKKRKK